jgi:hypothetical protein
MERDFCLLHMRLFSFILFLTMAYRGYAQDAAVQQADSMFYNKRISAMWVAPVLMQAVKLDNLPNSEQVFPRTTPAIDLGYDIVYPVKRSGGRIAIRTGVQLGFNPYRMRMNLYRRPGNDLVNDLQGEIIYNYRIFHLQVPLQLELRRRGGVNHFQALRIGAMAVYAAPGPQTRTEILLNASANSGGHQTSTFIHSLRRPGLPVSAALAASLGVYSQQKKNGLLTVHFCARYLPVPLYIGNYQLYPDTPAAIASTTSLSGNYVGLELGYVFR